MGDETSHASLSWFHLDRGFMADRVLHRTTELARQAVLRPSSLAMIADPLVITERFGSRSDGQGQLARCHLTER